jgi:hypothetical protein
MDSVDAQCLLLSTMHGKIQAPEIWSHDRSGGLTCAFGNSENRFTWSPEDVAKMAEEWRDGNSIEAPEYALSFRDAHEWVEAILHDAGLREPDVVTHDFPARELRWVWEDEEQVVVVDKIGRRGKPTAPPYKAERARICRPFRIAGAGFEPATFGL